MGSAAAVVEIVSDDEAIADADVLEWASHLLTEDYKGIGDGFDDSAAIQKFLDSLAGEKTSAGGDDDDCIVLDGDPNKVLVVTKENRPGEDGQEEELQVVAEKGELACRDFPHPRHLCAIFPFSTSSHANHCAMCHCYVCDSPAPCACWGKGTNFTDHCHATDKDAKWKKLRQEFKRKSLPTSNRRSIQSFFHSSSTPPPSRTTVIQPSARRVPAASNVSQNQQMFPSIGIAQNVGQAVRVPKMSSQRPKISRKIFKRSGSAPPVYKTSNINNLHPPVPNYAQRQSAPSHVSQTAQVASGSNMIAGTFHGCTPHGNPLQRSPLIGYENFHVQPTPYPQVAPGTAIDTGMQAFQHSTLTTQCPQTPDLLKGLQDVLANLASELGVSDYNINPPHGQQSASTQSMRCQLPAQVKASQGVQPNRNFVAATSQRRPSNGHYMASRKSGDSALAGSTQKMQPTRLLKSKSSLTRNS